MAEWIFSTHRFRIELDVESDYGHRYDGDDEDGETQRKLDSGEYVAFDSAVKVYLDGELVGADYLGASIYEVGKEFEFWTAHRDPNPMNRNCSIMRASHPAGPNVTICHYFPDMVRQAVKAARQHLDNIPTLRKYA